MHVIMNYWVSDFFLIGENFSANKSYMKAHYMNNKLPWLNGEGCSENS